MSITIKYSDLTDSEKSKISEFCNRYCIMVTPLPKRQSMLHEDLLTYIDGFASNGLPYSTNHNMVDEQIVAMEIPVTQLVKMTEDNTEDQTHQQAIQAQFFGTTYADPYKSFVELYFKERKLRETNQTLKSLYDQYMMMRGLILSGRDPDENT